MSHEVIFEDFEPTLPIKNHIEQLAQKLNEGQKKEFNFKFFLSKVGPKEYKVGIETHAFGKDLYAHQKGNDLYEAATQAEKSLKKQMDDTKEKKYGH